MKIKTKVKRTEAGVSYYRVEAIVNGVNQFIGCIFRETRGFSVDYADTFQIPRHAAPTMEQMKVDIADNLRAA